ncbi:Outer membrane protein assembly factor BamB, contains PQQ-like beta-propeller repeat [Methanococcoides vulcani]|uniref:Outer membrane protein assembly factor BamB, contains PQQ-like beta-propeller repeat n=1 Tax=Methanococcoides vulcani TaxID=1353158 RepID=A0A1H9YK21_9EURY|nr:PQQ-binding-like beta-propeller repeat protein [Methanococcoides vulcani]SES68862.1 Outer membrane protein assembly factor BamB, contains PQQ-like beta-propeller repeat [Methanococcoides vulcani]
MQKTIMAVLITLLAVVLFSGCIAQSENMDVIETDSIAQVIEEEQSYDENAEPNTASKTMPVGDEFQSPYMVWELELENVPAENISQGWTNVRECTKFSPDGKTVVVGTANGHIQAIDVISGEVSWEKTVAGAIYDMSFSKDGMYLMVGEKSQEGYIYSLNAHSGEEVHRYRTADDLGTHSVAKYQPAVYRIITTNDSVYVAASRYWKDDTYSLASRVYRFNPDGTLVWKLPASGNYDRSINWIDSSLDGDNVVFVAGDWTNSLGVDAVVHSVDKNGNLRWDFEIEPLKPYFTSAAVWHGLDVSDDGDLITVLTGDGRAYLFNDSNIGRIAKPEWQIEVSTPQEVAGSAIYAYGDSAYVAADGIIYVTGSTFPAYYPDSVPMEHPDGNSLLVYDFDGNLSWKYGMEGHSSGISFSKDKQQFSLLVGKNIVTGDTYAHGLYVFDNQIPGSASSKMYWMFNTEGIVVDSDISAEGYQVAIEVPVELENGDVMGEHRLILLR